MRREQIISHIAPDCPALRTFEFSSAFGILLANLEKQLEDVVVDSADDRWLSEWFIIVEWLLDFERLSEAHLWTMLAHALLAGSNDFGASLFRDLAAMGVPVQAEWCVAAALHIESGAGFPVIEILVELLNDLGLVDEARNALELVRSSPTSLVPWVQMDWVQPRRDPGRA